MESYYCNTLPRELRQSYHVLLEGLLSLDASISLPRLSDAELADLFALVRLDHPEIFYVSGFSYRFRPGAESLEFLPDYLFPKKQIEDHRRAIEARVRRLTAAAVQLDEKGRELYVHDFICTNVRYDKLKKPYSHEVIGPLTQGVGVCEGIAKTVKLLCNALGLPCIVAFSEAAPEKGIKYRHAWNLVMIGGKYYHLDATFDRTLSESGQIRYDYFNLGDASLFRDHEAYVWKVPACPDNSRSYYIENKLSFTKLEVLESRLKQCAKKGKPLVFQWRGGYLTREVLAQLCALAEKAGAAQGKSSAVSLNWPQAVLTVSYSAEGQNILRMEDANEGESPLSISSSFSDK